MESDSHSTNEDSSLNHNNLLLGKRKHSLISDDTYVSFKKQKIEDSTKQE